MKKPTTYFKSVDEYVKSFPKETAVRLKTIREIIKKNAPKAIEAISYNIPAYKLNGILVYFAGYERHIGIYPYRDSMKLTKAESAKYRSGKGTLRFPHNEELPVVLIERMVKARVKEQMAKKKA